MELASLWHGFPMVRAGGLFILLMGVGVVLGASAPSRRKPLLAFGGVAATISIVLLGSILSKPFGAPTSVQLWALALSIVLEVVLIALIVWRFKQLGERTFYLAILFVVGVHFLPMELAFGPLCLGLGLAAMTNAGIGLWMRRGISLNAAWLVDGLLKMGFGALMFLAPRAASVA